MIYTAYFGFLAVVVIVMLMLICAILMRRRRFLKDSDGSAQSHILDAPFDNHLPQSVNQYPAPPIPPTAYAGQQPLYQPPTPCYSPLNEPDECTPTSEYQQVDIFSTSLQSEPPSYEYTVTRPAVR